MQVNGLIRRWRVVHDVVEVWEVDTSSREVGAHQHGQVAVEELVHGDAPVRGFTVEAHGGEPVLVDVLGALVSLRGAGTEDEGLVLLVLGEGAQELGPATLLARHVPHPLLQLLFYLKLSYLF